MTVQQIFETRGLEAARKFARRSGDGAVVAEFIRLKREAEEAARFRTGRSACRPAPRWNKTGRDRANGAAGRAKERRAALADACQARAGRKSGGKDEAGKKDKKKTGKGK